MDTNPHNLHPVARAVAAAMEAGDWSEKSLAEATKIPRVTLGRRLAGGSDFKIAELEAIAATLGTTVTALVAEDAA